MSDPIARIQTLQWVSISLAEHIKALVDASDYVGNASERAEAFRLQALISARLDALLFAAARGADTAEPGGENVDEALREVEARIQNIRSNAGLTGQQISRDFFKDIELIMTVLGPEHVLPPLPPPPAKFVP